MHLISAVNRTMILFAAVLTMSLLWGFFHIPGANLLIVVFTSLSAALLTDIASFRRRLGMALILAFYASAAQFIVALTINFPALQIFLSTIFTYIVFATLPDFRAGCIVIITGCLAFFAPPGFRFAADRSIALFTGALVITAITAICHTDNSNDKPDCSCTNKRSLILAAEFGTGNLLFHLLQLKQGAWIMLTIMFITMSTTPQTTEQKRALQRIFAVPLGIITGGFLLETFFRMDYRFVYLVPIIGTAGFFILYNYGNFFLFSIFFMVTMTVFSDWMAGTYHRFNFWDTFFSRSVSSLIGALIVLAAVYSSQRRERITL